MKAEVFNMGSQFWWFYDVIVVAVALVCIFIGSRKGVMKGVFGFVSVIIAAVLAYVISGAVGDTVSSGLVCESNAKKISESIDESTFMTKYINYLENMGYSVSIDENKLGALSLLSFCLSSKFLGLRVMLSSIFEKRSLL